MNPTRRTVLCLAIFALLILGHSNSAAAQEQLCDTSFEDCRAPLIALIRAETIGLDVAWWFMEDSRYSTEIIKRWQAGVPVRIIIDPRANSSYPINKTILNTVQAAGIPMRYKLRDGILHWKMMLFDGQGKVEFSSANYSPHAFTPQVPHSDYTDEVIYFSDDPAVVNSFRTKYDELWTNTAAYGNYANIAAGTTLLRRYATFPLNAELNFPPGNSFVDRAISAYRAEQQGIDVIMYRITDERHTNEMIAAVGRQVPVRLIHEPDASYRNKAYSWDAYNIDRMYMGGVQIKMRKHLGQTHEKMMLRSQRMAVHASSNWSASSADSQQEHNYFTKKGWFYDWYVAHFERKWGSAAEFEVFVPLGPEQPALMSPASGALGMNAAAGVQLKWEGGYWAHKYDIYMGTDAEALALVAGDVTWVGRKAGPEVVEDYVVRGLAGGVKYYWKVVGKTMADKVKESIVGSFTTAGPYPPPPAPAQLTAIAGSSSQVSLSWTDVAGETGYVVERSVTSATSGWTALSTLGTDLTGHQDQNGVAGGRKYYYRVRAYNASGYSPYSAVAQATTPLTQTSGSDVVLWASEASVRVGRWNVVADAGAAGGARLANPNAAVAKPSAALASPGDYFEMSFYAEAGKPYRLWLRGKAESNHYNNDSVFVQFSGSVNSSAVAAYRIGTTSATTVSMEDCTGCGLSEWGWQDNASGAGELGALIYFAQTGPQIVRIQRREDGISIDQVVLSSETFLSLSPGSTKNDLTILPKSSGGTQNNQPPTVSFTASSTSGVYPLAVNFSANASDADGTIVAYNWNFGNGQTSTLVNPSYTYGSEGTFIATLIVADNNGAIASASTVITVTAPAVSPDDIVLYAKEAGVRAGRWNVVADSGAAGGARLANPNTSAAMLSAALASPGDYFEMSFYAEAGKPYRLWLRGKAESNSWRNDSVFVQFSGSVNSSAVAAYRIGTTSATTVSMEDCTGCGLSGWGWQDNASGAGELGALIYFAQTGPQTIRVQVREDGLSIDQVVLSPGTFLSTVPGFTKNDTKLLTRSDGSAVISPLITAVTPDSGTTAGGNQVTISGEGFLSNGVVTIGGMSATAVTVVDYNTIIVTVPAAAAGAADIIVSNPNGLSNTLTNGYTYTEPANEPPSVTLLATPTGGTAPVTIVFDAVASDPEGASLTYDWNFGDGTVILNSTAHTEYNYSAAGTFVATVTVTDDKGAFTIKEVTITIE